MDKYEKCAASLMELGDQILEKKKHRNMLIRRVSFSCASVFATVIVGFFVWKSTSPKIDFSSDNIVSESTTVTKSAYTDITSTQTNSFITTNRKITTKTETTRKETSTSIAVTSTVAVETSNATTTKINHPNTTHTPETKPVTSQTKAESTTIAMTTVTTTSSVMSGVDGDKIVYMGKKYRITGRDFADVELIELPNSQMPVPMSISQGQSMQLKLYEISCVSTDYAVAALIDNGPMYTLCLGNYTPETMQSLFRDTALIRYWSVDSIYEGRNEITNFNADVQKKVFDIFLNLKDMNTVPNISLGKSLMKICINSKLFGESTIELTENGYLSTNIGGLNSSYLIGRDEVDMIIESIKNEII